MLVDHQARNLISSQTREAPAPRVFFMPGYLPPHFDDPLFPHLLVACQIWPIRVRIGKK